MAYNKQYTIDFKNLQDVSCRVELLQKDGTGSSIAINGTSTPFTLKYQSGDYYATDPIRASEAVISIINEDGSIPLDTFISNDDTAWRVDFYINNILHWTGYINQDDCSEEIKYNPYEVILNATDQLGLLKQKYFVDEDGAVIYDVISLTDVLKYVLAQTSLQLNVNIYVNLFEVNQADKDFSSDSEPFSQTYINAKTFLLNNNTNVNNVDIASADSPLLASELVMDCYSVLQNLMEAWQCTIFQANGEWNIVRWVEANYPFDITGIKYNYNFTSSSTADSITKYFIVGNSGTLKYLNQSQMRYLVRPNQYVKSQFDYNTIPHLIHNDDLSILGSFLRQYTTTTTVAGVTTTTTIREYNAPHWAVNLIHGTSYELFIRLEFDSSGVQTDRYLVVKGVSQTGSSASDFLYELFSEQFYVNLKDKIQMSYNVRYTIPFNPSLYGSNLINTPLTDGTTIYYAKEDGVWSTYYLTHSLEVYVADLTWQTINLTDTVDRTQPLPIDGKMNLSIKMGAQMPYADIEYHYKGFKIDYYNYSNGGTIPVTSQYNQSTENNLNISKFLQNTIYFDDSLSNVILGAMTWSKTELTKRTAQWVRNNGLWIKTSVQFISGTQIIRFFVDNPNIGLFDPTGLVGGTVTVTGSASNNTTFPIPAANLSGYNQIDIVVTGTLVNESSDNVLLVFGGALYNANAAKFKRSFTAYNVIDKQKSTAITRAKIECTLFGLSNSTPSFYSILSYMLFDDFSTKKFIAGAITIDYANAQIEGTFEEITDSDQDLSDMNQTLTFNYLYSK